MMVLSRARAAPHPGRRFAWWPLLGVSLSLAGCFDGGASSYTVAGAHFPASLLCAAGGLLATTLLRILLVATGLEAAVPLRLPVYMACAAGVAVWSWLLLFGEP